MDIHKPKPVHGWREFLSEIGVIIIGVLIALAAEQFVEWLHWQHEVRETREALTDELEFDLGSVKMRTNQNECFDRRLAELQRWVDAAASGKALPLARPIGIPHGRIIITDSWEVAQSGQEAAHIPLGERMRIARVYGQIRSIDLLRKAEQQNWQALQPLGFAGRLTREEQMQLQGAIQVLAMEHSTLGIQQRTLIPRVETLHLKAAENAMTLSSWRQTDFCKPLFKN